MHHIHSMCRFDYKGNEFNIPCVFRTPDGTFENEGTEVYIALRNYSMPANTTLQEEPSFTDKLKRGILICHRGDLCTPDAEVFYLGKWKEISTEMNFIVEKIKFWLKSLHENEKIDVGEFVENVPEILLREHATETHQPYPWTAKTTVTKNTNTGGAKTVGTTSSPWYTVGIKTGTA